MRLSIGKGPVAQFRADCVAVPVFKGKGALAGPAIAVDKLLGGAVSRLVKQGEIKGRLGEVTILHTMGRIPSERIAVVGLGEKDKMDGETLRSASGSLVTRARALGVKHLGAALFGAGVKKTTYQLSAQLMAEGAVLGSYTFERYKKPEDKDAIESFTLIVEDGAREAQAEKGMTKGEILGRAQNFAKDLANEPSNSMTPAMLSEKARAIAKECGLKIDILSAADAAKEGMGAFLAVAKGSDEPAKFIVMRYRPSDKKPLALVGKGITFDSGGISLKPSQDMDQMKGDMSGAAAVLGAMWAIAQLKPKVGVLAVVPATENMPSGHALKPGDVVRSMGGKTIEIISTDAEGRLILADALEYANKMGAKRIVDIATLTGACVIALGEITTGLMSNDENLANLILKVSDETGEKMWRLPLFEEYDEQIKSEIADMKNSGGRPAGAITAGMFLKRFVGKTPWAHIDIAGTNLSDKARGYQQKGATGVCVRSLTELALRLGGR